MRSYRFWSGAAGSRTASVAVALVSLTVSLSAPALAASNKKTAMQVPGYTKLLDGAGPKTNDSTGSAAQAPAQPVNLSPITLDDANQPASPTSPATTSDAGTTGNVLKATVQTEGIAPKSPNSDGAMDPTSIKDGKINDKIFKQAKSVNAMPINLMEPADEAARKSDAQRENEKVQIAELWDEALKRSPEIQFVVQKLMPTSDHSKAASTMMGMLSTALYGAIGTVNMMAPNMGTYAMTGMGSNMIQGVLGTAQGKMAKNAKLSETEQIMLFQIIRNTADKLVDNYRHYKNYYNGLDRAQGDLAELKDMALEAGKGQAPEKILEMQYTLKKATRDVDMLVEDLKRSRQQLIDISGSDSVDKLDNELAAEKSTLPPTATPPTNNPSQIADKEEKKTM